MCNKFLIYMHTNLINDKKYIGLTKNNPIYRWNYGKGYKNCTLFYKAIQKYGWKNFKHEILFCNLTKEEAEMFEIELIKYYKSNNPNFGYNISSGGECGRFGCHLTQEHKEKISKANKGKTISPEHKKKISQANSGRHLSKKQKSNLSIKNKGCNNPMFGKTLTQEHRNKISQALRGKKSGINNGMFGKCGILNVNSKKVICIETNQIFNSMSEAERELNLHQGHVSRICKGLLKSTKGYSFKYYRGYSDE